MKNFKKVLSVALAVAMMACSMVIAASPASAEGEGLATVKNWGITEFNNFAGSGLTSDAPHQVISREKSVGWQGYAIYGMPSGNLVDVKAGGTYIFELDLDYSGLYVPGRDPAESALIADFYIQDIDACIEWKVSANDLQAALDKGEFGYTADGVRYFTVSGEVTIPTEYGGTTLSPEFAAEARLWTRGIVDYRAINMRIIDAENILSDPVGEWCLGEFDAANDMEGIRTNPYIENGNYTLPRGFRVMRGDFAESKLALGGASFDLAAGQYAAKYDLLFDGVFCADDDVLATAAVKNEAGETVATKEIKKSDTVRTIKDSEGGYNAGAFYDGRATIDLPFTAPADAKYTIEVYTTGKANMTVSSVAFTVVIPAEEIKAVEDKIDAIGDVKYDPDLSEDSGPAIEAARKAYDDLAAKYGDVSAMVSNYNVLTNAETAYNGKKTDYNDMVESAANVDEAIDAIATPITLESKDPIEQAEAARDYFISSYGEEKAKLHIKGLDKLKEYREQYNNLTAVKSGDVNGDGVINTEDALMVLQSVVGITELDENAAKAADVNSDEKIDTQDALGILQYVVGIRTELPYKD